MSPDPRPKSDGYRGIHDVYEYRARDGKGSPWDSLRIELQYRTIYQHAWATAVEVAGLLTGNEHKFGRAAPDYAEFFCMSSELISRTFEARLSCRPDMAMNELAAGIKEIDERLNIFNLFRQYNSVALNIRTISNNVILFFNKRPTENQNRTEVREFSSFSDAVRELEKIEEANLVEGEPFDVVLVRTVGASNNGSIQNAFRNYFADTRDFVAYLEQALILAQRP
jgi:putative GTP pyrophosphokinase